MVLYDVSYTQNLKSNTNELILKQNRLRNRKQASQEREMEVGIN